MLSEFLTGVAGSGKTYTIRQRIENTTTPNGNGSKSKRPYAILAATTGIAAVNLGPGVTTINAELKYFDTESLQDAYAGEQLYRRLKDLSERAQNLVIDECSMLSDVQCDIFIKAFQYVNELREVQDRGGLGLILVGDFLQLPPIKAKFAFEGLRWNETFQQENITKLTKVWRQSNPGFLDALNSARKGDGDTAAQILLGLDGITWRDTRDSHFEGTTIVATNKECDRMNEVRLDELVRSGKVSMSYRTVRWGKERMEWKQIPSDIMLAEGAYVMILSNSTPDFAWVNGDTGIISKLSKDVVEVELGRNKSKVVIRNIVRRNMTKDVPSGRSKPEFKSKREYLLGFPEHEWSNEVESVQPDYLRYLRDLTMMDKLAHPFEPYFDFMDEKWCIGEIKYMPVRLAYASTVHRSQGLTLSKVQIDPSNGFFGGGAMTYVALSRVKSHEGLTIIGGPGLLARRTNCFSEVMQWI